MFGKGKRERDHLERSGRRAPAAVVEIARLGWSHGNAGPDHASTHSQVVRMTTLRVEPEGEPTFEIRKRMRYGIYGGKVPEAGERIEVLYDPEDHDKVMVAPPTVEEERQRTISALSQANAGGLISTGGGKLTAEAMQSHQEAMAQAQQAQQAMEQFRSGAGGGSGNAIALAQLEALRKGGAMSDEEFEAAKARLEGEGAG